MRKNLMVRMIHLLKPLSFPPPTESLSLFSLSPFLSLSMRKYLGQFACLPCTNAHTEQEKIDFFKVLK